MVATLRSVLATRERVRLRGPLFTPGFGSPSPREFGLLRPEMRTGFQLTVLTGVAVEENDLLRIFGFRHGVPPDRVAVRLTVANPVPPV